MVIYDHIHIQYILCTISFGSTFFLYVSMLEKCQKAVKNDRFSPTILINLCLWTVESAISFVYAGKSVLFYNEEMSGPMVFWTGNAYLSICVTASTSITFLLLDRIFALLRPTQYHNNRSTLIWGSVLGFTLVGGSHFFFYVAAEWPVDARTNCYSIVCISKWKYTTPIALSLRLIIGFINGILALLLEIILYKYSKKATATKKQYKRANILTMFISVTELLFIFLPNLFFVIFSILGIDHFTKIGPYGVDLHAIYSIAAAFVYKYIINSSVPQVSTISSRGSTSNRSPTTMVISRTTFVK